MSAYILSQITYDGFERRAQARPAGSQKVYSVYYVEFDKCEFDWMPSCEEKIVSGHLKIVFVMGARRCDEKMSFSQSPKGTPFVDAVVRVVKVVDDDLLLVHTSEFEEDILVDFEEPHGCEAGQLIQISGCLQLELEEPNTK